MNKVLLILIAFLTFTSNAITADAEVFKWVDDQGNIHYSDKKPESQTSEEIKIKAHIPDRFQLNNNVENVRKEDFNEAEKPYKKKQKVTMYAASWCGYCKAARAYFIKNKISYAEYDIEKNTRTKKRYEQLGGTGVPLLFAKGKQMQGFSAAKFESWYSKL